MDVKEATARISEEGYCVVPGLLDPQEAERLDSLARPLIQGTGYVKLEGTLNFVPDFAPLCMHPVVLEVVEHFLGKDVQQPNVAMMWCQPGAPAGGLHSDWPLSGVPQPWPPWPFLIQTLWMLTDFTAENGATRVVPGSHLLGRPPTPGTTYPDETAAVGKKGSVLIWHGTVWHGNGANTTTDQHRLGANVGYIPWFVHRPREGWPLVRRDVYDQFPTRVKELYARSVEA